MATYDSKTALLVVDVQNDFADSKGSLYVGGAEDALPVINQEIERAAAAGAVVVYSRDWHPATTPHFKQFGGVWPVHCVAGTWGGEYHPDLRIRDDAQEVLKGAGGEDGYSAFSVRDPTSGETSATQLGAILQQRQVERVVVTGLATDYCVKETALDALRLRFDVIVLRSSVRAVDLQPGDGDRALEAVVEAGGRLE